jgi:hypothetical protein
MWEKYGEKQFRIKGINQWKNYWDAHKQDCLEWKDLSMRKRLLGSVNCFSEYLQSLFLRREDNDQTCCPSLSELEGLELELCSTYLNIQDKKLLQEDNP